MNIDNNDKEELFRLLEIASSSSSDILEFSSSDSEYHSETESPDSTGPKLGCNCNDTCCQTKGKMIHTLTKSEEQENLLLTLISQITNPELKEEYLLKLKKLLGRQEPEPSKHRISFQETLERFQKKKPKEISTNDLQHEINLVKKEIVELRSEVNNLKSENEILKQEFLVFKIDKQLDQDIPSDNEQTNDSGSSQHELAADNQICLIHHTIPPKWFSRVTIVVAHDFQFSVVAMIDSGSDLNCIQEGLIPSKYFEKSSERLFSANGSQMKITYELNNAHVCQNNVCFKIPSVLVKNMSDKVILGIPFISALYPFLTEKDGITTDPFGQKVKFKFASRQEIDQDKGLKSLLFAKQKHLNFLKQEIRYKKISDQLSSPILISKIDDFKKRLVFYVCSDLPNAFWHRKKHIVSLPYIKNFDESTISTKVRPIQLNCQTLEFCKKRNCRP